MLDPHTGQLIGTVDRLKSALARPPVPAPGKGDLPPGMPGYGAPPTAMTAAPPPGQPPKMQDRLAQAIQPQGQPPIDTEYETIDNAPEGMPPAPLTGEARDKEAMKRMGQALMQFGTPAQQVQGMKLLSEASRPSATEQAAADKQRYLNAIEDSTASDAAKDRARTMLELGADSKQIMETLEFDSRGLEAQTKQQELITKNLKRAGKDAYELGVLETEAERAIALIDESDFATGASGYLLSYLPFDSPAYNLGERLTTLKTVLGYDELANMRAESPTGGAIGQVTETETRWLQATQGSLDQFQDPITLKENIIKAVEGKKLIGEMHSLVEGMEVGDSASIDRYREIVYELGRLGQDIKERVRQGERETDVPTAPGAEDIEAQYGLR
jgi:hypothetical protein